MRMSTTYINTDFKQAFDSVNRSRMLNDLLILGIPKKLVQLIGVTMAGSKATVRVDNQYTSVFPITNGVRQGHALSSFLFDLVLEAILQKMNITGHIGTKSTQILAYADDVAIMSRSENAFKDTLFNTEKEARRRGLLVNENKTKHMQVARPVLSGEHLWCGKHKFEHVTEFSYLGLQMNQTNSIRSEIQALNRSSKFKIYIRLIRPVVTYGCEAWTLTS